MKKNKLIKTIIIMVFMVALSLAFIKPIIKGINYGLDLKGGFEVLYLVESLEEGESVSSSDLTSTYKAIRNRIDTLGVSEPEITIEGDKIRVKLPGVTDEETARNRLATPAVLTFRNTDNEELMNATVLKSPGASLDYDRTTGKPVVALAIKDNDTFYKVTKEISESTDQLITIWLDWEEGDTFSTETCGRGNTKCVSYASVEQAFSSNVVIRGNFSEEECEELIDFINSGSLPTKLSEISTKTVDASFGEGTLKTIAVAGVITLALIVIILVFFYRFSGLISSACLMLYVTSVFILFNLIDGVLTLTGIAALILGIGMAVDSSIITLEKIKEEISEGKSLKGAYKDGNKRSLISLIDANITTFLAAVVLFIFGESSVKGFATMLMLTIIVTMLTMVLINRYLMNEVVSSEIFDKKVKMLLGKVKKPKERKYLKLSKYNIGAICVIVLLGTIMLITKGMSLGIDFNGGSAINVKSEESINLNVVDEKLDGYEILEKSKISDTEAYYKLSKVLNEDEIKTLRQSFDEVGYKSNISVISNIVKRDLTKNAVKSLIIASIVILIYIAIRFTFNFGVSSIIAILSDVLVTISLFAILRIEINFVFVAAILTIIGYSINDTIIVFDLIRDNLKKEKKIDDEALENVVNNSIKSSLKRNILTSITTLSAVAILLIMNISSIKEFNLAVLFGLIAGTFSSLFVAPYIWLILEKRSIRRPKKEEEVEVEERLIKGINA